MRELTFDIVYEEPSEERTELLGGETAIQLAEIGGCAGSGVFEKLVSVAGPPAVLDGPGTSVLDSPVAWDRLTGSPCERVLEARVLERSETHGCVHFRIADVAGCETVYTLAEQYLGEGVLFECERDVDADTWHVLMESDEKVGMLYDGLHGALRPELRLSFGEVGQSTGWHTDLFGDRVLSEEQEETLERAVESGYYETPRETTLEALAAEMDCPPSTVSYRLRVAEAHLATSFVESGSPVLGPPPEVTELSLDSLAQ